MSWTRLLLGGRDRRGAPSADTLDWTLLGIVAALLLIGLVMLASASMSIAESRTGNPFHYFNRQLVYLLLGLLLGLLAFRVSLDRWQRSGPMLLGLGLALLLLVLVPGIGKEVNGSSRWLSLGVLNVQVSEVFKLCFIVYLAGYLLRRGEEVRNSFSGFLKPMLLVCLAAALLIFEPDFGATVIISATALGMLFLAGAHFWQFLLLFVGLGGAGALLVLASPYRLARVTSFLNPWDDPFDKGFQLVQSLIAIGSGAWNGVGLGGSVQKLFYLPEAHTDFLFAVLAEELGLIGVLCVIGLFAALVWRILQLAVRAERCALPFGVHLAQGMAIWLALQAFINIGVNMGLLPTKGLTLPLMSYGGSSLLITCLSLTLLLRVAHECALAEAQAMPRPQRRRDDGSGGRRAAREAVA